MVEEYDFYFGEYQIFWGELQRAPKYLDTSQNKSHILQPRIIYMIYTLILSGERQKKAKKVKENHR